MYIKLITFRYKHGQKSSKMTMDYSKPVTDFYLELSSLYLKFFMLQTISCCSDRQDEISNCEKVCVSKACVLHCSWVT